MSKPPYLETDLDLVSTDDEDQSDYDILSGHTRSKPTLDPDALVLRSGASYPRSVVKTLSKTDMAQQNVAQGAQTPQIQTPLLKILPTTSHIEPFVGKDDSRSAQSFFRICEDSMVNSGIVEPADKIAFIKNNLKVGSVAHQALRNQAFVLATKEKDYETFKSHFLRLVGGMSQKQTIKVLNRVTEKVLEKASTCVNLLAGAEAHESLQLLEQSYRDFGWIVSVQDQEMITMEHYRTLTQLFLYMLFLKSEERPAALALEFKKDSMIWDFQESVANKLDERRSERRTIAAVLPPTQDESLPVAPVNQKPDYSKMQCLYCSKMGHTAKVCPTKRKDRAKARAPAPGTAPNTPSAPSSGSHWGAGPSTKPKNPPPRPQSSGWKQGTAQPAAAGTAQKKPYCVVHRSSTHDTTDCYSVLRLGDQVTASYRSGEGLTASRRNPP